MNGFIWSTPRAATPPSPFVGRIISVSVKPL
jgi:hypothetical protein